MKPNKLNTRVFNTEWQAEEFYQNMSARTDVGRLHLTRRNFETIMRERITYWEVTYSVWYQEEVA